MACATEYDKPVTIEQLSGSADAHGHIDNTDNANWSSYTTSFARVISRGGREFWKVDQQAADVTHVWVCPYDSTVAAATPDMRLKYNSTVYQIVSVIDVDLASEEVEIQTKRAV